ncbi:MAG: MFS transporter [Aeriscardovia sp.]|nr:MFS transporter [Aeriscardovia sp.]
MELDDIMDESTTTTTSSPLELPNNGSFNDSSNPGNMQMVPNKHKYKPWWIFAGCCMISFIGLGLEGDTRGQFYKALRTAFHVPQDKVSLMITIQLLTSAIVLIFGGHLLEKFNSRVLLSLSVAGTALGYISCYFATQLWQMYIIMGIIGFFYTVPLLLAPTVLLSNWFEDKFGLVLSLMFAFTALGGTIFQPIAVEMIKAWTWRGGYVAIGISFAVCILPFTLFVLKFKPDHSKGEYAWGEDNIDPNKKKARVQTSPQIGMDAKKAFASSIFVFAVIMMILFEGVRGFDSYMQPYQVSGGLSPIIAATVCSCATFGSFIGKTYAGALLDKLNTNLAVALLAVPGVIGWIGLFCTHNVILARFFAFWAGSGTGTLGIIVPWIIRQSFGGKDYSKILARINVFAYLTVSFTTGLYGYIYDWCGKNYHPVLVIVILCFALSAIVGLFVFHHRPMKKIENVINASETVQKADIL